MGAGSQITWVPLCFGRQDPPDTLLAPQMYRLTLRTSKEAVSRHLCELLSEQF